MINSCKHYFSSFSPFSSILGMRILLAAPPQIMAGKHLENKILCSSVYQAFPVFNILDHCIEKDGSSAYLNNQSEWFLSLMSHSRFYTLNWLKSLQEERNSSNAVTVTLNHTSAGPKCTTQDRWQAQSLFNQKIRSLHRRSVSQAEGSKTSGKKAKSKNRHRFSSKRATRKH